MDELNEKILGAYKTSILGIGIDESKWDLYVKGKKANKKPMSKKEMEDMEEKFLKNDLAKPNDIRSEIVKEGIKDFVDDSELKEKILKDIRIDVNKIVMNDIIPRIKKSEDAIKKKYKLNKDANMFIKNYGTAFLHDIFRELIGQSLVSSGNLKKRY
jgi:hypothetical protein